MTIYCMKKYYHNSNSFYYDYMPYNLEGLISSIFKFYYKGQPIKKIIYLFKILAKSKFNEDSIKKLCNRYNLKIGKRS